MTKDVAELYWDSTYAIVVALINQYPDRNPEGVGLYEMAHMIESLPGFEDDPALANERILLDIQIVWFEEWTNI